MSYGMVESHLWITYAHKIQLATCITQPIDMKKIDPTATKMVFIRYPAHFKGYVMYREHPSSGMTKLNSHNVDVHEYEFPRIGEIKKHL